LSEYKVMLEGALNLEDVELLAPLVIDEILIRLLRSPIGTRIAQIGLANTGFYGVEKAIAWLRANFSQPMKVEELAERANMSVSSIPRPVPRGAARRAASKSESRGIEAEH
jgi:hypothetical protein